jgi:transposase
MSVHHFFIMHRGRAHTHHPKKEGGHSELNCEIFIYSFSPSAIMDFHHISDDLKMAGLHMHFHHGWVPDAVADHLGFSERSLYRWKERFLAAGVLSFPRPPDHGCPHILPPPVTCDLMQLVEESPEMYLKEIQEWLDVAQDIQISRSALAENLHDCGLTYKLLHKCAAEWDEALRAAFQTYAQENWVTN